ncbi:hypothetical protein D7V86_09170 [bacterium D16-51]|nr:hypothetical protein D7V96_09840 [bacterium D16-59]RKI60366.1 hypothetical protein D7V86_09170 [bacterium D16-51]
MRKNISKKLMSMLLASSMVVGSTAVLAGCGSKKDEVITLDVYSQLANYSGLQTGWIADILEDKFKVKLNIIPEGSGVYETRMESGDLGDIVVWAKDNDKYPDAVKNELLYDWNEDDLVGEFGPYIKENMKDALKKNQELTSTLTDGERDTLYGFGHNVATSSADHEAFFYTWDIRWDLYKELGYPEVNNLEDYEQLLKDMVKLCPKDDSGNKTYAISLWTEWDDAMVMYVKAMATAYYGYDELGLGLYDSNTGTYHDALEKDGPYLTMLKFFNNLHQDGLLDPDSMTQTYDKMIEKVQNGGTMFSIFNYSGYIAYNKPAHTKEGKGMFPMKPKEATPIVYGMNTAGGDRVWTIGAKCEYPELCMEVINYFCTPEGRLTMDHGPKGVTWDYDDEGNTYFTELGEACNKNKNTKMGEPYKGSFQDGTLQIVNTTWSADASNPESNGETYNADNWKSNLTEPKSDIEADWRDKTGARNINEYMENSKEFVVAPGTSFAQSPKEQEFKTTWSQVTDEVKNGSWRAIYADSDKEYEKIVNDMIKKCKSYGYDECVSWSKNEASRRKSLEDALQQ